jgi:hypothetical protein
MMLITAYKAAGPAHAGDGLQRHMQSTQDSAAGLKCACDFLQRVEDDKKHELLLAMFPPSYCNCTADTTFNDCTD